MSNKAELYIKSLREPISITMEEADAISRLMGDNTKDNKTRIVIEGVFDGSKGEVKFVKYPPKEDESAWGKKIEPMTAQEAEMFEKKIFPYQIEAEATGLGTFHWPLYYMQAMGAIRIQLHVGKNGRVTLEPVVTDIHAYPKLQDEVASYYLFIDRKTYGENMRLKQYEGISTQGLTDSLRM